MLVSRFATVLIAFMILLPGCIESENKEKSIFKGEEIDPPVSFRAFELLDSNSILFNSTNLGGQVVLIAFLFTNCYDICPIISSNLNWLKGQLGDEIGTNVSILSITVDPWRDTPEVFLEYGERMNLSWPHLTIDNIDENISAMEDVWQDFGVGLEIVENNTNQTSARHHPMDYDVDHSTGTVLVDKDGMQRVWWSDAKWMPELVLEDVRQLLNE